MRGRKGSMCKVYLIRSRKRHAGTASAKGSDPSRFGGRPLVTSKSNRGGQGFFRMENCRESAFAVVGRNDGGGAIGRSRGRGGHKDE